jgi:hypothetical protein
VIWQLAKAVWGSTPAWPPAAARPRGARWRGGALPLLFTYRAYSAGKIAASGHAPSDETQKPLVATLFGQQYGKYVVAAAGIGVLVAAGSPSTFATCST